MVKWALIVQLFWWNGCTPSECPVYVLSTWDNSDLCIDALDQWFKAALVAFLKEAQRPGTIVQPWTLCTPSDDLPPGVVWLIPNPNIGQQKVRR